MSVIENADQKTLVASLEGALSTTEFTVKASKINDLRDKEIQLIYVDLDISNADGDVIGTAHITLGTDRLIWNNLRLDEDEQENGIATSLAESIVKWSRDFGFSLLKASVAEAAETRDLFVSMGFDPSDAAYVEADLSKRTKLEDYVDWKKGKKKEPNWHKKDK